MAAPRNQPGLQTASLSGALVRAGAGMTERRIGNQVIIEPLPQRGRSGSAPVFYPFDVAVAGTTATVRPGTMNSLVPGNMFAEFEVDATTLYYVKVVGSSDGATITACSLVVDSTAPVYQSPVPFALPTAVEIPVAVIHNGTAFRVIGNTSISLSGVEQFRTDKSPPAQPGELTYTPYYTWVLQV